MDWQPLLTVVATGVLTGGVSYFIARQQIRAAENREAVTREEQVADRTHAESREHALAVHTALVDLIELGIDAKRQHPMAIPTQAARSAVSVARRNYLLIADPALRVQMANALTLFGSAQTRAVTLDDWHEAAATASFVIAAYLRGEPANSHYVARLEELRAAYPPPSP